MQKRCKFHLRDADASRTGSSTAADLATSEDKDEPQPHPGSFTKRPRVVDTVQRLCAGPEVYMTEQFSGHSRFRRCRDQLPVFRVQSASLPPERLLPKVPHTMEVPEVTAFEHSPRTVACLPPAIVNWSSHSTFIHKMQDPQLMKGRK